MRSVLSSFFTVLAVLLAICFLNACKYSSKAASRIYGHVKEQSFDMVIVPGVPLKNGMWDSTMKGRIYWAKWLYDRGVVKNIMFSGSAVYTPYYEGEVMALYAEAIGIPREHIFTETKAEHSTENLYYSYKKSKKLGFKTIALASDPFQSKLLTRYARKIDDAIVVLPLIEDSLKLVEPMMIDPVIKYETTAAANFIPITERESFFKRLLGTFGSNVKQDLYD